ncbi:hypothetical protein Tco_1149473, partial [Tanacetum coccineum]
SVNNLKADSENDNDKVNIPLFPSPEPTVNCINDLDFFKDFENEFPAIVYNDALTSKSDFSTKLGVSPQRIDKFDLKEETSLSECDKEEQNVLCFDDLFSFNVIYPDELRIFIKELNDKIVACNYLIKGMLTNLIKNLYVPFGIPFDPKLFYKDGVKLEKGRS